MGVTALIILTIVALGHTFYSNTNVHKYNHLNKPVHIAYYSNAIIGSIFLFISFTIFILIWGIYKIHIDENFKFSSNNIFIQYRKFYYNTPKLMSIWLFSTLISILLVFLCINWKNYRLSLKITEKINELTKNDKVNSKKGNPDLEVEQKRISKKESKRIEISEYQIYEETLSDPLDRLISNSAYEKDPQYLLFTMKDKKVYVGKVKADPEIFQRFSQGLFNFLIEPQYSGYRDKDTLEVILTTSYVTRKSSVYEIVIDKKEILSATKVSLPDLVKFLKNKNQFADLIYEAWVTGMPILIINKENIGFVVQISDDLSLNGNVSYKFEFLKVKVIYQIIFKSDKTIDNYLDFSEGKDFSVLLRLDEIKYLYAINTLDDIWVKNGNLNPTYWINLTNYRSVKKRELF